MLEYSGTLLHGLRQMGLRRRVRRLRRDHLRSALPPRRRVARRALGPRGRAVDAGAGLPPARRAPGSITSPASSASRRWPACAASRRRRWRCRTIPTSPTSSSRRCATAATAGCWCRSTRSSSRNGDGAGAAAPAAPAGLPNSAGETASIIAIIKTQGSDTKLVAQMQPYYEAKGLSRWDAGRQRACRRWSPRSPTARTAA